MILAAIVIARNPAQYGFDFEPEPPAAYEKVTLPRPVDLRRVAEWADTTIDDIQALNPELRRWTTPVRTTDVRAEGAGRDGGAVQSAAHRRARSRLASLKWYTVKHGDTLPTIARKLNVSKADLAEANYLSGNARVTPGRS